MAPLRLRVPTSLAVVLVGASASAALILACDQPVTPDPVDGGRLEKTSDAHQSDGNHVDSRPKLDGASVTSDAERVSDAPRMADAFVPDAWGADAWGADAWGADAWGADAFVPTDAPPQVDASWAIDAPPDTPHS